MNLKEEEELLAWREQVCRAAITAALAMWGIAIVVGLYLWGGTP
jgi:hypothetical protein